MGQCPSRITLATVTLVSDSPYTISSSIVYSLLCTLDKNSFDRLFVSRIKYLFIKLDFLVADEYSTNHSYNLTGLLIICTCAMGHTNV